MDNYADHDPPPSATQDADLPADTDIFQSGHGFNPKGEAQLSGFVNKYANMDMSWLPSFLSDMGQSLPKETETRPSQTGLGQAESGDLALSESLQQLADDAYALREPEPPKTRQDLLREVMSGMEGRPSSRIIYPNQLLVLPWPYGDKCTAPADRVCEACAAVRLERRMCANNVQGEVLGFKLADVKKTAKVPGCPMCRLLLASFRGSAEVTMPPWGEETLILVRWDSFASLSRVTIKDGEVAAQTLGAKMRYYTELIDAKDYKGKETSRYVGIEAKKQFGFQLVQTSQPDRREFGFYGKGRIFETSQVSMELLKDWKTRCMDGHAETCRSSHTADGFHPGFRVIDVKKRCILDAPVGCEYVALSYVWGSAEQLLNEEETSERLETEGGLDDSHEDIPLTIRDAMLLCDSLGFQYIWIDALCIQQDDSEDKEVQINHMDAVYSKAAVTIIAACGTDCNSGLPGLRPNTRPFKPTPETIGGVTLSPIAQPLVSSIALSSWDGRGWTLQEKLLSRRALIVTDTQYFWHCSKGTWYEDSQLEAPPSAKSSVSDERGWPFMDNESEDSFERYKKFAMSFIHRKFTIESDAMDAVKGILKKLAPGLGNAIYYGIPEKYLDVCLIWDWPGAYGPNGLLRVKYFPSWSWVAVFMADNVDGLHGVAWDAVTTIEEYLDSHVRMRLGTGIKVCTMVKYFRYTPDGEPIAIQSEVFQSSRDPSFREYLTRRELPPGTLQAMPVRFYTTEEEYTQIMQDFEEDESRGIPMNDWMRPLVTRSLGFFAERAQFYVSSPPPTSQSPIQKLTVTLDPSFTEVVGHVTLDTAWRSAQGPQLDFIAVARHASNGPHTNLRRNEGWFFHCLLVERVFSEEALEDLGSQAEVFVKKVAVLFDVDCELWEQAGPELEPFWLI